jgi:hypothetical protein
MKIAELQNQPPETKAPVEAQDAWDQSLQIAKGLSDLLSIATGSAFGLSPEAAKALEVTSCRLVEEMGIVDSFFNPKDQE